MLEHPQKDAKIPTGCRTQRNYKGLRDYTDQGTKEVDSFQDELLVSYSGDAELLQFLMGDVQQLLSPDLLPLKTLHILLEAVIQAWEENNTDALECAICLLSV